MQNNICLHCGMEIAIRNPSGYCDHLYYPDNCEICKKGKQMNEIILSPIKTDMIENLTLDCKKILQSSEGLAIANQTDLDNANIVLRAVKSKLKELDESRKAITSPLDEAKKRVMSLYKIPTELLEKAESLIKRGMITFTEKMEQERQKQEEELRRKMLEKAEKAEAKGKVEKAEEIRQQAELTTVASSIEKPKNISFVERWYAVIVDEKAIPREYLCVDMDKLNAMARATKGTILVPGVQFKSEKIIKSRA